MIICPRCQNQLPDNATACPRCGMQIQFHNTIQSPQPQINQTMSNDNLVQCSACGNMISKLADKCPVCGNPRQKKVANPIILDAITVFAVVAAIFAMIVHKVLFSWATVFIFLIIYALYYEKIKNNPNVDSSKVKQSMTILAVLFLILFLVVLIFNIPLR